LRERREDIPRLVEVFLDQYAEEFGKPRSRLAPEALEALVAFDWPGNVKELKELIEGLVLASSGAEIGLSDLPERLRGGPLLPRPGSLAHARRTWEREYIAQLLVQNRGSIAKTARQLAISERHLQKKIAAYGLSVPGPPGRGDLTQRTLRRSVLLCGQGLHSGLKTGLILSPLPPNSGIRFGSITSEESIPALVDYVVSTAYATTLRKGPVLARTIEHLMAVLHA
jgi:two-component system nitrogen regulation response regulator NtrX